MDARDQEEKIMVAVNGPDSTTSGDAWIRIQEHEYYKLRKRIIALRAEVEEERELAAFYMGLKEDWEKAAGERLDEITRLRAEVEELRVEIQAAKDFGGGFYGNLVTESTRDWYRNNARRE